MGQIYAPDYTLITPDYSQINVNVIRTNLLIYVERLVESDVMLLGISPLLQKLAGRAGRLLAYDATDASFTIA